MKPVYPLIFFLIQNFKKEKTFWKDILAATGSLRQSFNRLLIWTCFSRYLKYNSIKNILFGGIKKQSNIKMVIEHMLQFENGLDIADIKPIIGKMAFGILHWLIFYSSPNLFNF